MIFNHRYLWMVMIKDINFLLKKYASHGLILKYLGLKNEKNNS